MGEGLSFASYAECLRLKMQKPFNKQLELTELLLGFLIFKGTDFEARGKENCKIDINKTMASNLFRKKENVHSSIQENCDLDIAINGIKKYFEDEVLPVISPHMMDDLIENMVEIIKSDTSISKKKKKEFLKKEEENDISGFLSSVFLYAVKKDNTNEKQIRNDRVKVPDTNEQYYNSFIENLFLHREKGSKIVRLKDLFVMPKYEEIWVDKEEKEGVNIVDEKEKEDDDIIDEKKEGDVDVISYISKFSMYIINEERHQGEILFIEGDAGVGKTSLVSYLSYLYKDNNMEWKQLFQNKVLLCIRLRDIIPEQMKFSSDTIVKDILNYLDLKSINEFKRIYKDALIVLDGFDELCMVEGITVNSEYYIYQIFKAFMDYRIIITTRPQYLDVKKLDIRKKHIVLQHFDASQRSKWVSNYRKTRILEYEKAGLEYILDEKNEEIDSICDTPMVMYMIVAGGINEEAKHNKWVLYHQIFYKELSDTEYNSMFSNYDGIYSHGIKKYQELLYRLSAEISYKMFCSGNAKLYLTEQEILDIVNDLKIEDFKLKEIVQHCYALCNYWKSNGKGAMEFYHNNIRDFFLCEKIFYEFNSMYQVCEALDIQKVVTYIIRMIYDLFRCRKIPRKVIDFLYLRTKYKYEHHSVIDFPSRECQKRYLPLFFSDMAQYGGVSHYDRSSEENVYGNMVNVLTNTVEIFRFILEPYLTANEYIIWFNDFNIVDREGILGSCFRDIFISLVFDDEKIGLASRANFSKMNFIDIDLRNVNFIDSNLEGARFSASNMEGVCLENCILRETMFIEVNLCDADLRGTDLSNAILKDANLRGANLKGANLSNVELNDADLRGANLKDANLSDVELNDADLRGANLKDANLSNAKLNNANLKGADLRSANLRGASLIEANLREVDLRNTILPDGFKTDIQYKQLEHLKEVGIQGLVLDSDCFP